ncbi:DUF1566 domain-containing protein [uncultured Treponema sp.]|uniref:InlB B-repeat-containing protein n=1 Tax=uncultured Treponema sp. TaxID=162155 RepID=UPI0025D4EC58|nr:DUF1566 domain-containing protein [uncultured Treponema sp.]
MSERNFQFKGVAYETTIQTGGVISSVLILLLSLYLPLSLFSCKSDDDNDSPTYYTITISSTIENGSVSADKTSAASGVTITLTLSAAEGYEFESLSVTTSGGTSLTTTAVTAGTTYTFTMPESNVTVSATFKATAVTPQKTAGSISYATASVSKTTADEAFTNTLTNTGDGTVSYASSKTDVATVNATTGEVTIVGAGESTITATVADSDTYTYATKTASYTLTVTQAYTVTIASGIEHGTVTADKTSAEKDATVTLTLSASNGYEFGTLSVMDASNAEITTTTVTEGSKYTFTMPESNVTVSATFTEMRTEASGKIGKYEKPYKVGDIVFSDGSATPYEDGLTDEQKSKAVAVIFYAGSVSDILGAKTLGVGLKNTNDETTKTLAFARNASGNTAEGYSTNITVIQCTPSESGDGKAATATFTGDLDGSDNWTALCAAVSDEGTSGNYPAWEWVNTYATTANLTGDYASGWYLPTVAELCMLYREKATVNAALEKAGGTKIADAYHWSSSQSSTNSKAWLVKFENGKLMDTYKGNQWYVCGVRAFN